MKYFTLVLTGLRGKPVRSLLTLASLFTAFLLFGLLDPVSRLFSAEVDMAGESRLWVSPRHSISDMLPVRYANEISRVEGVDQVSHQTWFGGTYIDPVNNFTRWAVTAAEFLQLYPQVVMPDEQAQAFVDTRTGAIVGRITADRFGMKIGDKIPLTADIWHNANGSNWEFDLVGIYDVGDSNFDGSMMFLNYDFFDDYRIVGKGLISNVVFRLEDQLLADQLATTIDSMFENSGMETTTTTEQEWLLGQVKQMGNIGLIIQAVMGAVFFTILLLTGNTMSQSIRERIPELAVLKTLGFQRPTIMLLVLAESLLLTLPSAVIGLLLARWLLQYSHYVVPQITTLSLSSSTVLTGLAMALALGFVVGMPPAVQAMRLNIVEAGRRG